ELGQRVEIDAGMHAALLVVDGHARANRCGRLMPDLRQDLNAKGTVAVEGDEVLRTHVAGRLRQHGDEGSALPRAPDLPAIGMVIGMVNIQAIARGRLTLAARGRGVIVPTDDVGPLHRLVATEEQAALRPHRERTLRLTRL